MGAADGDTKPLILDFLEWLEAEPRSYTDVMDAWRTSCPRLTVWEDSHDLGLVTRRHDPSLGTLIELTPDGRSFLAREERRRKTKAPEVPMTIGRSDP